MKKQITTLLLVIKNNKILLALKLRGFGVGKYNGVGGKQEQGESVEETMLRETFEEIGIVPTNYCQVAEIDFEEYVKEEKQLTNMNVFIAYDYNGTPVESDEMSPCWFDLENIPYDKMFKDDKLWLPYVLQGKKIKAHFVYDKDYNILSHNIDIKQ